MSLCPPRVGDPEDSGRDQQSDAEKAHAALTEADIAKGLIGLSCQVVCTAVSPDEPAAAAEGVEDDSVAETDPPADLADVGAERVLREVGTGGDEPSAAAAAAPGPGGLKEAAAPATASAPAAAAAVAAAPDPGGLEEATAPAPAWGKRALPQGPQPQQQWPQQWRMGQKKHTPENDTARLRRRRGQGPRRQSRAAKKVGGIARASNGSEPPQNRAVEGEKTLVCGRQYVLCRTCDSKAWGVSLMMCVGAEVENA